MFLFLFYPVQTVCLGQHTHISHHFGSSGVSTVFAYQQIKAKECQATDRLPMPAFATIIKRIYLLSAAMALHLGSRGPLGQHRAGAALAGAAGRIAA